MTSEQPARRRPNRWTDWLLLALAVVSVVLVVWVTFVRVPDQVYRAVLYIDLAICIIFALDYLNRWRRAGWGWKFLLLNWYEILGMIPIMVVPNHGLRLLRIVVVLARLGRAIDRIYGDRVTSVLVDRAVEALVRAIQRPITVAILAEVGDVLKGGHYTRNITAALQENRREMDDMILEKIKNDPAMSRLRYVPFHDDIVRLITDTVFRILLQVLADPRTDELVADLIRENVDQIKLAVAGKYEDDRPANLGMKNT